MTTKNPSHCFLLDCISKFSKDELSQKNLRFPQFVYNELFAIRPDLAEAIIGTRYDFYFDEKIEGEKWNVVSKLWSQTL